MSVQSSKRYESLRLPLLSSSTSPLLTKSLQRVIYTDYNEKTNEYNTDLEKTGGRMTEGGQSGGQSLVLYRQLKVHVKKKYVEQLRMKSDVEN